MAEIKGEIVGFAAGMTLSEPKLGFDSELTAIYLIPSVQRAGIGRRLVAHVAATLASAGANTAQPVASTIKISKYFTHRFIFATLQLCDFALKLSLAAPPLSPPNFRPLRHR